ncbi:phosphotransferase [Streptomyces sp. NPDC058620]|uniref:phosphotransferase n=1 Tax=Streptomyces sp. NPDC058620 TaxID=3346560 RepID=UPI00365E0544
MHTGQPLGSGRTADVYAIDESWVLRRHRDGTDATPELAVMAYLAATGFPVPRIGPPAGPTMPVSDLVLQRLTGPTMAEALLAGTLSGPEGAEMLARLLRELHTIPPRLSHDPDDRIIHLDLHPENVMLTPHGPMVIDWSNASEGPPALDRAMSCLILAQVSLGPTFPAGAAVRALLAELLHRLAEDGGVPADALARARTLRTADPFQTERELAVLDEAAELVAATAAG